MTTYTVLGTETRPKFEDYAEAQEFVIQQEKSGRFVSVMQDRNGSVWTVYKSQRGTDGTVLVRGGWAK